MTIRVVLAVLEDDPIQVLSIRQSIKAVLPDAILRIEQDGQSFLENLDKQPLPDVVVLDINVPKISGLEALRIIREKAGTKDYPPIVMFSTDDSSATRLKAAALGATGFEVKPPLAKMGLVLKDIVERYAYQGAKPDRIEPLLESSSSNNNDADFGDLDDLLNSL